MNISPMPTAFLPIATQARELDARLLLAAFLAREGYRVVVGRAATINAVASRTDGGLYFSPLMVPATAKRLRSLRTAGHTIIAWDEEGLVYPDPAWYFGNRVSEQAANLAHTIVAWGPASATDLAAARPGVHAPIVALGNPRFDVLRHPYRNIYEPAAAKLRARFGSFVLVNTNFDLVNHVDGPDGLLVRMRRSGRMNGARDEEQFVRWAVFRQAAFDGFRAAIPQLHALLDETISIVIRPHPSEDPRSYRALAAALPRLFVEPATDSVVPWILSADAVVHNSCTTAVESFLLGTPAIAFHPTGTDIDMGSPLPNALSRPAYSCEQVASLIRDAAGEERGRWVTDQMQRVADDCIAGYRGDLACESIVALATRLGAASRSIRLPAASWGPGMFHRSVVSLRRALKFGWGLEFSIDDSQRFGVLNANAIAERLSTLSGMMGHSCHSTAYGTDAVVVESAT